MLFTARRNPTSLLLLLAAVPLFASAMEVDLERYQRTVTEQPFEIIVDQRACGPRGLYMQVLGSGGPELDDRSAGSGYLLWQDGRARVLIDAGPGVAYQFEQTGAKIEDLVAILFTNLQVDHTADFVSLLEGSRYESRTESLPVYGPSGNDNHAGFSDWIDLTIGPTGAWRYLSDFLSPLSSAGFEILPYEVDALGRSRTHVLRRDGVSIAAIPTDHGRIPALAWRVDINGVGFTFTGDTANRRQTVADLAEDSALLIAHHSVPENVRGAARELHMPPSQIGRLAAQADVNMVVLSHRSSRTRGRETQSRNAVTEAFLGPVVFANDLECWEP